ncbi:hypothetical protein FQZ97_847550 [compost metagenome]
MTDLEVLADLRHVARQQQRRGVGQALVEGLDGHLLEVRVVQPDLLTIGDQQLLHRRVGVPAEQPRALEDHLAGGLLQLGAGAVQGQLREAASDGLGLAEQFGQTLHRTLAIGQGRQGREAERGDQQQADQAHENPRSIKGKPASAGPDAAVYREFSRPACRQGAQGQSRIGAGAITSREPLVFIAVTTPAISIASIIRAARL